MAIITLPSPFDVSRCSFKLNTNQRVHASSLSLSEQAVDMLSERWTVSLDLAVNTHARAAQAEAFVASMRGQTNIVALYHVARPQPRGTIAGAKTLAAAAAQGAASVSITATGTLLAGDMFNVATPTGGVLLLIAAADCTSVGGVITVPMGNRLRVALASGAAVTTSQPTALFRLLSAGDVVYVRGMAEGTTLEFGEYIPP